MTLAKFQHFQSNPAVGAKRPKQSIFGRHLNEAIQKVTHTFTRDELMVVGEVAVNYYSTLESIDYPDAARKLIADKIIHAGNDYMTLTDVGIGIYAILVERGAAQLNDEPLVVNCSAKLFDEFYELPLGTYNKKK